MEPITVRKDAPAKPTEPSKKTPKNKKPRPAWLPKAIVGGVIVLAVGAAVYFYQQYVEVRDNPGQAVAQRNSEETEAVLNDLKAVILIQETETPTVARVDDPAKLKSTNEEFYKNVEKNDYLVIYPKRAILFRQSNGQIINVAPIINTSELQPDEGDSE
jgi:hypothetical protein